MPQGGAGIVRMSQTLAKPASPAAPATARPPRTGVSLRYRAAVAARAFAAVVLGYAVAYGSTAFLTVVLPFARNDRVIAASLACFFVWCAVAMYAFAARSAWRALAFPALWAGALYGVALLFPEAAARP